MPPAINLTEGATAMLTNGEQRGMDVRPVLQVVDVRFMNAQNPNNNSTERYRLLLSDGIHLQQAMLFTQRNDLVRSQKLQKGSVVRLTHFICNLIQNHRAAIECAIGAKPPSYYEVMVPYLRKERVYRQRIFTSCFKSLLKYGCSLNEEEP